jgi:hypothetical protein
LKRDIDECRNNIIAIKIKQKERTSYI